MTFGGRKNRLVFGEVLPHSIGLAPCPPEGVSPTSNHLDNPLERCVNPHMRKEFEKIPKCVEYDEAAFDGLTPDLFGEETFKFPSKPKQLKLGTPIDEDKHRSAWKYNAYYKVSQDKKCAGVGLKVKPPKLPELPKGVNPFDFFM